MVIQKCTDPSFRKYGRIVKGLDLTEIIEVMQTLPCPENVIYVASEPKLEELPIFKELQDIIYGELPIQVGYCNGENYKLNALEYHRASEVNIAATDMILMLGSQQDVTDEFTYETSKVEAFFVPKGTAVELYGTTLHYAPCSSNKERFRDVIVLPKGTNTDLEIDHNRGGEDALITAKNKWLIGHAEGGLDAGSHIGLIGENLTVE